MDSHKKCIVYQAFFFTKPNDRETFLQGGRPEFLELPGRQGNVRQRNDYSDDEFVPKAKRPGRASPPLPFPTIAINHHQPYQPSNTYQTLHTLHPLHSPSVSDNEDPPEEN